jgi:YD repeat-containing protein
VTTDLIYTYDSADRVITTNYYEAGETVSTSYDAAGRPYSMCGTICYVNGATYNALGQPQTRALNNGLTTSWVYTSPMQRLQDLQIGTVATPTSVTHRDYAYDPVGNIQTIIDYVWGQNQNFTYDARDRLIHAGTTGSAGAPGMAYTIDTGYDVLGNLTSKTGVGNYSYGSTGSGTGAGPHQARTVNGVNYSYDADGNISSGAGWNYTWNADNTLASLANASTTESYTYDADGERVSRP